MIAREQERGAAWEREACAAKCSELADLWRADQGTGDELPDLDHGDRLDNAAKVIRLSNTLDPAEVCKAAGGAR